MAAKSQKKGNLLFLRAVHIAGSVMQFRNCTHLVQEGFKYCLLKFFLYFRNFSLDIPETFCDEDHGSLDICPATVFKLVLSA